MKGLPEEMWFGTITGQWPIQCWESETHAMRWLADATEPGSRVLWKAKIVDPVEYVVVTPKPYLEKAVTES